MKRKGMKYNPENRIKGSVQKDMSDAKFVVGMLGSLIMLSLVVNAERDLPGKGDTIMGTCLLAVCFGAVLGGSIVGAVEKTTNYILKNKNIFWAPNQDGLSVSDSQEQQLHPS